MSTNEAQNTNKICVIIKLRCILGRLLVADLYRVGGGVVNFQVVRQAVLAAQRTTAHHHSTPQHTTTRVVAVGGEAGAKAGWLTLV